MDTVLAGHDPVTLMPGAGVTSTVGLTLHQSASARKLFVDVNNFNINASTDTITDTSPLTFSVVPPSWLAGCNVRSSVVFPDLPPPGVQVDTATPGVFEITLEPVHYYAGIIIEPITMDDGDGDGVSNDCDDCPDTPPRFEVDEHGCSLPAPGDFDRDKDVDLEDYGHLQGCYTAVLGSPAPGCEDADLSGNDHVTVSDLRIFAACLRGPNVPADPNCANGN